MKSPTRLVLLVICLIGIVQLGHAQHRIGWRASNYAGINGASFNPALSAYTPHNWDFNLIEAGIYFDNNYAFLQDVNLSRVLRERDQLNYHSAPNLASDFKAGPDDVIADFFTHDRPRFAHSHVDILGPAFSIRIAGQHRLGAFLRFRSMGSTTGLSESVGYYQYDGLPFGEDFFVDEFSAAFMNWAEVGGHYSVLIPSSNGYWSAGINVRRIIPYDAFFVQTDGVLDLTKISNDSLGGNSVNLTYGLTHASLDNEELSTDPQGQGWGIDLGISYASNDYLEGYGIRVGLAVQDLGRVTLDQNSELHSITVTDPVALDWDDYSNNTSSVADYRNVLNTFSEQSMGDPTASLAGNTFDVNLPTTLAADIDWAIQPGLHLHAAIAQPIPVGEARLSRRSYMALTPRFDHKWFGVAMPISLHAWQHFQLGLQGRLGPFVLGTDKVGSWLSNQELHQANVYIGLKLFPFGNGNNRGPKAKTGGRIKGATGCYDF